MTYLQSPFETTQQTEPADSQTDVSFIPTANEWARLVGSETISLTKSNYILGRHRTADIPLTNIQVSNKHCEIYKNSEGIYLQDFSTNGTRVNGSKIGKGNTIPLQHQDHIEILPGHLYFINLLPDQQNTQDDSADSKLTENYFLLSQVIGSGTFATVKVAIEKKTGKRIACKIIDKKKTILTAKQSSHLDQEIQILKSLNHPNVTKLMDIFDSKEKIYILLELVSGGELFEKIQREERIPELEARFLFYQILLGVEYLHSNMIIHRDLKPENILIGSHKPFPRVYITDFGLAKIKHQQSVLKTMCGTLQYLAPEVFDVRSKNSGYNFKVDCWSLGVVLYAMLSGCLPFPDDCEEDFIKFIKSGKLYFPQNEFKNVSEEAKDLMRKLMMVRPDKRFSIQQALGHPWISDNLEYLRHLYEIKISNDASFDKENQQK